MDKVFGNMSLEDSDEEETLEELSKDELKLLNLIKLFIKKRKYRNISLLFTTGKYAASNLEMLAKMYRHLFREVWEKHLTEENNMENVALYACAEYLLARTSAVAPPIDFLFEIVELMEPQTPDCVFFSALKAAVSPLLRVDDGENEMAITIFEECLEDITLRRDACLPLPKFLFYGVNSEEISFRMEIDNDVKCIISFYYRILSFYTPLVKEICARTRPSTEIFRSCKINQRNVLCFFLIRLLDIPLALFDLKFSEQRKGNQSPLFFAESLTLAVIECVGDPFFLLNYVDLEEALEDSINYFFKNFPSEKKCLAVYFYMIIVEDVGAERVPKVYHPLYVCERILHMVHYILKKDVYPPVLDKILRLATKVLNNLGHIKLHTSHLEIFAYSAFLADLLQLVRNPNTVVVELANTIKQFIDRCDDKTKYNILKKFMETTEDSDFYSYLISLYKDIVADALKSTIPLSNVFTGQHMRVILLENICKLKTTYLEPGINYGRIEAALQTILMLSKSDTENRTGFWSYIDEIHTLFITPLRNVLQFCDDRYKSELLNARQGNGASGKRGRGFKCNASIFDKAKRIDGLKNNISDIVKLRVLASVVCESLSKIVIDDKNNNNVTSKTAKAE